MCCWRRLLRVPWTARRSDQSILREINPEHSLEGQMLKLKLQYLVIRCEQLTHWTSLWCWERLRAEEEGIWGWEGWMASPMQCTWTQGKLREMVRDGHDWHAAIHGVAEWDTTGQLNNNNNDFIDAESVLEYNPPKQNRSYGKMLPILGKKYKAEIHWCTTTVEEAMHTEIWNLGLRFNSTQTSQSRSLELLQWN